MLYSIIHRLMVADWQSTNGQVVQQVVQLFRVVKFGSKALITLPNPTQLNWFLVQLS
jgi:hypothetical protein